jgi:hypothetical protein
MARIFVGLIAAVSIISGAAYYLFQESISFHVAFSDVKQLAVNDIVYLSGQSVGKVVKIAPDKGKIDVAVHIDRKYQDQCASNSSFFIDQDTVLPGHMSLLVRNPVSNGGSPLEPKDKIEGIDSFLVWSTLEVADKVHEIVRSEPWKDVLREASLVMQDFRKSIKKIDIDRLGAGINSDIETLSNEIDSALQGNESRRVLYELQNQIEDIQKRLKRLGDSEESQKLQEALNNFQKKVSEEINEVKDKPAQ